MRRTFELTVLRAKCAPDTVDVGGSIALLEELVMSPAKDILDAGVSTFISVLNVLLDGYLGLGHYRSASDLCEHWNTIFRGPLEISVKPVPVQTRVNQSAGFERA